MKRLVWMLCTAALAFAFTAIARNANAARLSDAQSVITINQPFEVPGHMALPAGTYWFVARAVFGTGPDEVLIYNADRTKQLDRIETIPARRMEMIGHERLTFAQQANAPDALVTWFAPGHETG